MQRYEIPLSEISFSQKLDLMEVIWNDLTREENNIKSPAWHEEILKEREEALISGKISISDWKEAKARIRENILCT